jgi:hypothetical protein
MPGVVYAELLPNRACHAHLDSMKTTVATKATATSAAVRARRAAAARLRRAQDKADCAIAVKRLVDLDSGKTKAIPAEEAWRELGI